MVKKLVPAANAPTNGTSEPDNYVGTGDTHVMSFDMADVADFNVNNVVLDKSQAKGQNGAVDRERPDKNRLADLRRNGRLSHRYRHLGPHGCPRARLAKVGAH